jgi:hypothetical protein
MIGSKKPEQVNHLVACHRVHLEFRGYDPSGSHGSIQDGLAGRIRCEGPIEQITDCTVSTAQRKNNAAAPYGSGHMKRNLLGRLKRVMTPVFNT